MPTLWPPASSTALIMWVVVVLPLVPVTPIIVISSAGRPKKAVDKSASAYRVLGVCKMVTPARAASVSGGSSCWITSVFAPFAATSAA